MNITWIASFPKSGNTWVRFLLYHYFWGELRSTIELNRRIPDIHRPGPVEPGMTRMLLKTHFLLSEPKLAGHAQRTERAIHIRRNPRDVLLSGLNFRRLAGNLKPDGLEGERAFALEFINAGADPMWTRMGFGTWERHILDWTETDRFPVLALRYEDLKNDAEAALTRIIEFLDETPDSEKIRRAVELSDFQRMRSVEVNEKKSGADSLFRGGRASLEKNALFMNTGKSNQTLAHLGEDVVQAFDAKFLEPMSRLGYGGVGKARGH